jgi:hypothetical protein
LLRAGELVTEKQAEGRVLMLINLGGVVDTALFDDLLNFGFNSFSGDTSLNWLMDL